MSDSTQDDYGDDGHGDDMPIALRNSLPIAIVLWCLAFLAWCGGEHLLHMHGG